MMRRILHSTVYGLLSAFLLWRYATDALAVYVHPRLHGLILAAGFGLLVLCVSAARPRRREEGAAPRGVSWFGVLMVGGAAVVGLLIAPQSLGSAAVTKRGLNVSTAREASAAASATLPTSITNLYDGSRLLQDCLRQKLSPEGVEVDVTGFVFRDAESIRDYVFVARFAIACCSADAMPVGMIVRSPAAAGLKKDQWIRVRGRVTGGALEYEPGRYVSETYVQADTVEPVEAQKDPYIYLR